MAASITAKQLSHPRNVGYCSVRLFSPKSMSKSPTFATLPDAWRQLKSSNTVLLAGHGTLVPVAKSAPGSTTGGAADDEDGVSLGTMKLPLDTDIPRFEILLFQWANSLCQGAQLPLPQPLKVDKIAGGARLGFVEIGNGETETLVYIDCVVYPPIDSSGPVFKAMRKGALKDKSPAGEPRIMKSLLAALKTSVEIARL